ncbi:MAG: hypothetical protein ACREDP_06575 [Bradyrhizobium sp.]
MLITTDIPPLAVLAVFIFFAGFVALFGLMALIQPIWCVIDCAVDTRRGSGSKVVWIILLIVFYGLSNWFYGAFAASGRALRWLTRIAWVCLILLVVAFVGTYMTYDEFRRGIELEWKQRGGMTASLTLPSDPWEKSA